MLVSSSSSPLYRLIACSSSSIIILSFILILLFFSQHTFRLHPFFFYIFQKKEKVKNLISPPSLGTYYSSHGHTQHSNPHRVARIITFRSYLGFLEKETS
jgi:hypothetical protein